jgi:tetrapyrrole methylase family protein/MazG family protein
MSQAFDRLQDLIAYLRGEKGCPWDRDQTLKSLKPHLLEEMHEVYEAIEEDDNARLREEVGDLLFLILFAARIAEEEGRFSIDDVLTGSHTKMKARHPHVFGKRKKMKPNEVVDEWEKAKRAQKTDGESALSGVPRSLPSLVKAQRIQQRAASLGFDWENVKSVFEKLREEIGEFEEAWHDNRPHEIRDEMGDILFSLVNVSRFLGISAEEALQGTIEKFKQRFSHVEKELAHRGMMTLNEMDEIWEKSKGEETV